MKKFSTKENISFLLKEVSLMRKQSLEVPVESVEKLKNERVRHKFCNPKKNGFVISVDDIEKSK